MRAFRRRFPCRRSRPPRRAGAARVNGLLVLLVLVATGVGSGAAYYRYRQPRLAAEIDRQIALAPSEAAGRLGHWHEACAPMIHQRLTAVARLSDELPYLVTHAVAPPADAGAEQGGEPAGTRGPVELYGIELEIPPGSLSHIDGLEVVVTLPEPRVLGRFRLSAEESARIPIYAASVPVPDPRERLVELTLWFLEGLPAALEKDIPGASIRIEVARPSGAEAGGKPPLSPGRGSGR